MDEPEIFKNNIKKPGLYYIETDSYFPLRGNGWYSQAMVNYCIKNKFINMEGIKYVIYSSLSISGNYYNDFIDYLNKNVDSKLCVNTMVGCFKLKIREHWKQLCMITNKNDAMYHFINNKGTFIDCRTINETEFYEIFIESKISHEESESPIYNQILEQEAIELHKLSKIIENKNGYILDLSTDCVSCVFPDGVLPFELEGNNIKGFYYDYDNKFHKYKIENKADDYRLKVSKMKQYIRTEKYEHKFTEWKII